MDGLRITVFLQRVRDGLFSLFVRRGFASFGVHSRILLPFRVGNPDKIAIGDHVLIGFSSWLMVPSRENPGVVLEIHDRVRMNQTSITAVKSVVIERDVDIARGVYISDHAHGFDLPDVPIRDQPLARVAPVRICRGAWLGQNVVIMPGVTVGAGAVVGANSVVTADVPPRTVALGSPARIVRKIDA